MKRTSYFRLLLLLPFLSVLFVQCKKGDAGPQGPAGPAGPQGPKGDSATAGIIYSGWLDVTYKPDTVNSSDIIDTIGFYANITVPKLTSTILSGGEVKVYLNLGRADSLNVVPLPFLDIYSGISISPQFFVQKIFIYANGDAGTFTAGGKKYWQYRYILIPGSVAASSVKNIDWKNYGQVQSLLDVK